MFELPVPISTFREVGAFGNDTIWLSTVEGFNLEPTSAGI